MAKDLKSLSDSRDFRSKFISRFGFMPKSILEFSSKDKEVIDLAYNDGRTYTAIQEKIQRQQKEKGIDFKGTDKSFSISGSGTRGKKGDGNTAISLFPQNIGRIHLEFYCPIDGIVYDPFAGHNSRMQLCYQSQRNYVGVDLSEKFHKYNELIREELIKRNSSGFIKQNNTITLYNQSSHDVPQIKSNSADFTITSPPYWDMEWYGDEQEQLGKNKTYNGFLNAIEKHIQENFRILKNGTFCCWFINDFVKQGIYYPYHADLIPIFEDAGFVLHTINIINLQKSLMACFAQMVEQTKRFPKIHEYCIIFRKEK